MEIQEVHFFVVKLGPGQFRPFCKTYDKACEKGEVLASFNDVNSAVADAKIRTINYQYKGKEGLSDVMVSKEERDCLFYRPFNLGGSISSNNFRDMEV